MHRGGDTMRSCATPGGGVMFIQDEIKSKKCKPVSYKEFIEAEAKEEPAKPFRKKPKSETKKELAAA